jgi:hypothetical protein
MTDFRALCAELADWIHEETRTSSGISDPLVARARAALAQPEPQGPTDEELIRAYQAAYQPAWERGEYYGCHVDGLRAVLARWGRPAIEPVPVSERLPGPEDCDAEGQCWWWDPDCRQTEAWRRGLSEYASGSYSHWLPHWVLPVPGVEGADA